MDDERAHDPWGLADPPAAYDEQPLPPRLAELAGLTAPQAVAGDFVWPSAAELPEVAELLAAGWHVLDGNALDLCLLPTVWPREHRCWVADRLPRVSTSFDGTTTRVLPSSLRRHEPWDWTAESALVAGLPAPPPGRIWLLRSPWPWLGFAAVVALLRSRSQSPDSPAALSRTGAEVLAWTPEELDLRWTGPQAHAAAAWAAAGRYGDDVADLVVRGLGPGQLDRIEAGGVDERQALAWSDSTSATGDQLVEAIATWRSRGLPADPPEHLWQLRDWPAEQVEEWLAAGFGVADLQTVTDPCDGVFLPLEQAIRWRDAGFTLIDAAGLLGADRTLQPAEAVAFRDAGLDHETSCRWVQAGFGAADALAWTGAGLSVQRARLWRSRGHGPGDVGPGQIFPSGWSVGAWFGRHPRDNPDAVLVQDDPPGTRGERRDWR